MNPPRSYLPHHRYRLRRLLALLAAGLLWAVLGTAPPARAQPPAAASSFADLPVQQADAALKTAVAAGDEPTIISALSYRNHPGILEDALKVVTQRRPAAALPRLIELFTWLNTADGGPVWTGDEIPYNFEEHRAGTTMKLSDEVVAAVDAITAKALQAPKDHSYAEAQRYLNDVKAWWQAHGT